ncbi:MAG: hypothetical protein ACREE4_16240, partial [Stellaceae bacterium]
MQTDDINLRTYADVMADYRRRYGQAHQAEMRMFGNPRQTLKEAIWRACMSQIPTKPGTRSKRHPPSGMSRSLLNLVERALPDWNVTRPWIFPQAEGVCRGAPSGRRR